MRNRPDEAHKAAVMTDPAIGGVVGTAAFSAVGGPSTVAAGGAGLAAVEVMLMTAPRSPREWAVGPINTVGASIGAGAAVIEHVRQQHWVGCGPRSAELAHCAMGVQFHRPKP